MLDSISLGVIRSFAAFGRETLDLHALFEAGGNDPAGREAVLEAVARLVERGLLEEVGNDFYALTAQGRAAAAGGKI